MELARTDSSLSILVCSELGLSGTFSYSSSSMVIIF